MQLVTQQGYGRHPSGKTQQAMLTAAVTRREALPGYVPACNSAPVSFHCSYLVGRPETETEETGELTACAQEAIQAAAGCEESSYPGGKRKENNKTQRRLLFAQHHLSYKDSLLV